MGIIFGVLSLLFFMLAIVGIFKPSILKQQKRSQAFAVGITAGVFCIGAGMYADGIYLFWDAIWFSLPLFIVLIAISSSGKTKNIEQGQQQTKIDLTQANNIKKNKQSPLQQAVFDMNERHTQRQSDHPRATIQSARQEKDSKRSFDPSFKDWESTLTTLWAGDTTDVEFTYNNKKGDSTRRKVTVDEVLFGTNGEYYIKGYCHVRAEQRTFKVNNITTKIKVGNKRYEFDDWCEQKLGIDPDDLYRF